MADLAYDQLRHVASFLKGLNELRTTHGIELIGMMPGVYLDGRPIGTLGKQYPDVDDPDTDPDADPETVWTYCLRTDR